MKSASDAPRVIPAVTTTNVAPLASPAAEKPPAAATREESAVGVDVDVDRTVAAQLQLDATLAAAAVHGRDAATLVAEVASRAAQATTKVAGGLEVFTYGGKTFTVPKFSGEGARFDVAAAAVVPSSIRESTVARKMNTVWDLREFEVARAPVSIGHVEDTATFSQPGVPRTLDMPIKLPGSDIRLPAELAQFRAAVEKIVAMEKALNPEFDKYYAYITVDQRFVDVGDTQRQEGAHVDGFQGARIIEKLPVDHSYIVSDCLPTRFFPQPFSVAHLDEARHNFFLAFDKQKQVAGAVCNEPFEITLFDAYAVHEGVAADASTARTFLRVSFTVREYDRLGNAHNPMLDYAFEMVPRDTQSSLSPPP